MPGGHSLFGTRASASQGPRPHSAADFPGGRFLGGPSGNKFRPLGPLNILVAAWVRLDSKPAGQSKIVALASQGNGLANDDILGLFYDQPSDQFFCYASSGVGYTLAAPLPAVHPAIGSWYLLVGEFGGSAISLAVTDPNGVQQGGSAGFGGVYNAPANANLGIGALPLTGSSPLQGALDSVQYWNSTRSLDFPAYFGAPGAIWNNGKALDFNELPASAPPTTVLQLYLDFNEPTAAAHYADRSPNAFPVSPAGSGTIRRIAGAGY